MLMEKFRMMITMAMREFPTNRLLSALARRRITKPNFVFLQRDQHILGGIRGIGPLLAQQISAMVIVPGALGESRHTAMMDLGKRKRIAFLFASSFKIFCCVKKWSMMYQVTM